MFDEINCFINFNEFILVLHLILASVLFVLYREALVV